MTRQNPATGKCHLWEYTIWFAIEHRFPGLDPTAAMRRFGTKAKIPSRAAGRAESDRAATSIRPRYAHAIGGLDNTGPPDSIHRYDNRPPCARVCSDCEASRSARWRSIRNDQRDDWSQSLQWDRCEDRGQGLPGCSETSRIQLACAGDA